MRLWSLHPQYLDRQGLVALWREGLLAQAVLSGTTRGYRHHPQLQRFRTHPDPASAIGSYLQDVAEEADRRGYRFDRNRILPHGAAEPMPVTTGQLRFERSHLIAKLLVRDRERAERMKLIEEPVPHPCFYLVDGPVEGWERAG